MSSLVEVGLGFLVALARRSRLVLPIGIFLGVLFPGLASSFRPFLPLSVICLYTFTLILIEPAALAKTVRSRPLLVLAMVVWVLIGAPAGLFVLGRPDVIDPWLHEQLILTAASPPIFSAAAFALMLGLDAALALAVTLAATALLPLTMPPLVLTTLGLDLGLSSAAFFSRLALFIGAGFLISWLVRRRVSAVRLRAWSEPIRGLIVLSMLAFGVAVMDGVTAQLAKDPLILMTTVAALFLVCLALQLFGTLVFSWTGPQVALTAGLVTGYNNLGVVVAAMSGVASDRLIIFLGLAQFPIYILPMVMAPVLRRWIRFDVGKVEG
ncbi:MAG: hypothetical protein ACFB6S_15815 [Geminicoccaceae bacterium]